MTVIIAGNPDLTEDATPLRILPRLIARFPNLTFRTIDPNEEWDIPPEIILIDTVANIQHVQLFSGLDQFTDVPRMTMHDFDVLTQLRYLKKLGKLRVITIIGVPPNLTDDQTFDAVTPLLHSITAI